MKKNLKKITIYISNADAEIKCNQYALGGLVMFATSDELGKAIDGIVNVLKTYKQQKFDRKRIEKPKVEPKQTNS